MESLFRFVARILVAMVVRIQPGMVSSLREVMKKETLVNVPRLVLLLWVFLGSIVASGGGEFPVGNSHAMIGETRGSNIDAVRSNSG